MLLYIIRHGDPIYSSDSLTQQGKEQAKALAERLAVHGLDRIYSSPLGRAVETGEPTCRLLGLSCEIENWTSENDAWNDFTVQKPDGGRTWAFHQQNTLLRSGRNLALRENWYDADCLRKEMKEGYDRIIRHSDEFLARQGYAREGTVYRITKPVDDRVAVFCHQGFGLAWISHLLQIPPQIFWAGFDITHTGVSVFCFENHADGFTAPKCLCLSDMSHLYKAGLPLRYNNELDI